MKREGKLNRLQKNMLLVAAGLAVVAGGMIALNPGALYKSNADVTGGSGFSVFPKADGVILKFKSDVTLGNRTEVLQNLGLTERACIKEIDTCIYDHNAKKDALEEVVDRARIDSHIQFAEENRVVPASFTDNKPDGADIPRPTPPSKTNPLEAWKTATGKGVMVAIISSGVDESHKQLGVRQGAEGYNFIAENASTNDKLGFGTALAGVILANSTDKFAGMAPDATYMPLKVTGNETTDGSSTLWNISRALVYAGNKGAKVVAVGYDVINYEPIYCNIPSFPAVQSLPFGPSVCMRRYANPSVLSYAFSEGARYLKDKGGVTVTSGTVPKNSTEDYYHEIGSINKDLGYPATNIIPQDGVALVASGQQEYPKGRTFANFTARMNGHLVTTTVLGKGEPTELGVKSGAAIAVGQFAGVLALMREAGPNIKPDHLAPLLCFAREYNDVTQYYDLPLCDFTSTMNYPTKLAKVAVDRAKQVQSLSGTKTLPAPTNLDATVYDGIASDGAMFKVRLNWTTPPQVYSNVGNISVATGYEVHRNGTILTKSVMQKSSAPDYQTTFFDYPTPLTGADGNDFVTSSGQWIVHYSVRVYDALGNYSSSVDKEINIPSTDQPYYLPYNVSVTNKSTATAELSFTYPKQLGSSKNLPKKLLNDTAEHKVCYIIQSYTGTDNFRSLPSVDSKPVCMNNPKQGEVNSFQIAGLTAGKLYQYWLYEMRDAVTKAGYVNYKGLAYQVPLTSVFRTASVAIKEVGDDVIPRNILATPAADGKSATVYWTTVAATTAEVVYDIAKSADGKTVGDPHKSVADNVKQTKHTVTLKTNSGLKYYYKIFSYAGSVTKQSDLLNFTAKGTPDLTVTLGKLGNSATVSWTPSTDVTYDVVYATTRSKDGATVGDPHKTISSNTKTKTPSVTLSGLTPNTTYFVKAISYAGKVTTQSALTAFTTSDVK